MKKQKCKRKRKACREKTRRSSWLNCASVTSRPRSDAAGVARPALAREEEAEARSGAGASLNSRKHRRENEKTKCNRVEVVKEVRARRERGRERRDTPTAHASQREFVRRSQIRVMPRDVEYWKREGERGAGDAHVMSWLRSLRLSGLMSTTA